MKKTLFIALTAAAALASCSHNQGWTIKGTLDNAPEDTKLAVLGFNAGVGAWYVIDSVEVSDNGSFSFTAAQPSPYSDIYSISLGDKAIYFPIDSAETLSVKADANSFDTSFEIQGTDLAEAMRNVDRAISRVAQANGIEAVRTDSILKRQLTQIAIEDGNGLIAYYIISKQVGGKPLFSTDNRADVRTIGAVANNFAMNRPDDPRTKFLEDIFLSARRASSKGNKVSIEAPEISLFDIDLFDSKGVSHSLADVADKGKVVLLSFVRYGSDSASPYNIILHDVYDSHTSDVDIYQVSVNDEEMVWKDSARNIPWTSVYLPSTAGNEILSSYNVGALPMTFIINRNGDIAERVIDPATLASAVKKYL